MPPHPRRLIEGQAPEELLRRRADHDTIAEQLVPAGRIARDTRFLEEADCEFHQARFQQLPVLFGKRIPLRKKFLSSPAMSSTAGASLVWTYLSSTAPQTGKSAVAMMVPPSAAAL